MTVIHPRLTLLFVMCSAACSSTASGQPPPPSPRLHPPHHHLALDSLLGSLSPREKIAQLVMPWIAGSYAAFDDAALSQAGAWVDSLRIGGIIISVGSPLDIAAKLNHLQRRSRLPLLVAADFESGTAIRLEGGTPFPPNMGVAATGRESDAYDIGRITALEGRAVGVHLSLAPVADVNNNPANPIINVRSFGEEPQRVARLVAAGIKGIQDHGMLATAKHFPGHGDTGTDSHLALPVLAAPWSRLDSIELPPFRAAIASRVSAIMSAHIAVPGLDRADLGPGRRPRPATLAAEVLDGVLRDSLGFEGLVVTDALNMGGIVRAFGEGEAAVLAFLAGADLLLQPADPRVAIEALERAVQTGRVSQARLDQSVRRLLNLKARLGLLARRDVPLERIPSIVGTAESQAVARSIAARSIVLARDTNGTVARLRRGPATVSLISVADQRHPTLGSTLARELRSAGFAVSGFTLWPQSGPASYDSARAVIAQAPVAMFVSAVRPTAGSGVIDLPDAVARLIEQTAARQPVVSISLGSPYIINQTPSVGSYLLGWVATPMMEAAVAHALGGAAPITGTLPIGVPPALSRGAGARHEFR